MHYFIGYNILDVFNKPLNSHQVLKLSVDLVIPISEYK